MTTRDRWTIYPLLFLAIGLGLNACIQGQADHAAFEGKLVHSAKIDGDVVICKELVVLNESGKPVVELSANDKSGAGILQVRNGNGTVQAVLSGEPPGGVLRMLDTTGKYYQFPSLEHRPFPLLPAGDAKASEEQPAAKDDKAEK